MHSDSDSESSLDDVHLKSDELYQQSDCPLERGSSPGPEVSLTSGVVLNVENGVNLLDKKSSKPDKIAKPMTSQQMNMRGVFLHVMADALGSVIVCISALIIMFTDWQYKDYVDPSLSVLMVCLIMYSTYPLLVESAMILLQTVPTHIQVDSLQRKLLQEIDGVLAVHEFHVWQLAGDRIIASAHIRCRNLHDYMQIAEKIKTFFHNKGIHSTTIQPEFVDITDFEVSMLFFSFSHFNPIFVYLVVFFLHYCTVLQGGATELHSGLPNQNDLCSTDLLRSAEEKRQRQGVP